MRDESAEIKLRLSQHEDFESDEEVYEGESDEEHQEKLDQLRRQIRQGTYRPAIGDIAVKLISS